MMLPFGVEIDGSGDLQFFLWLARGTQPKKKFANLEIEPKSSQSWNTTALFQLCKPKIHISNIGFTFPEM